MLPCSDFSNLQLLRAHCSRVNADRPQAYLGGQVACIENSGITAKLRSSESNDTGL